MLTCSLNHHLRYIHISTYIQSHMRHLNCGILTSFPVCLRFFSSCKRVHGDLIILIFSLCAYSHDEAKTKPESPPWLGRRYKPTHTTLTSRKRTMSHVSPCESITLTDIVLLFTRDRVAADFSVLDCCQVPEKKQGQERTDCFIWDTEHMATLGQTNCSPGFRKIRLYWHITGKKTG